jgi:mRNA interferase MazF
MHPYIPKKGDLVVLTFDPQAGHKQKGRRPALVISNTVFNAKTGLAFICPVTNTRRGIPIHVPIPESCVLTGVVMVDQAKSIDFVARKVKFVEKAPAEVLNETLAILDSIIY